MQSKLTDTFDGVAAAASYDGTEVINARHDGYRRAGFVLKRGRNELPPVDYKTLLMLEADPFLTVTIIGEPYDESDFPLNNNHNIDKLAANQHDFNGGTPTETNNPPVVPPMVNPVVLPSDSDFKTPQPTREQLLFETANHAVLADDPAIYFNQDGSVSITKWKALLGDDSLTKDEINAALEAAKATQKSE